MNKQSKYAQEKIECEATCVDCNYNVIHLQSLEEADYFVYCSNELCKNHEGEDVFDFDCPEWVMHMMKIQPVE